MFVGINLVEIIYDRIIKVFCDRVEDVVLNI